MKLKYFIDESDSYTDPEKPSIAIAKELNNPGRIFSISVNEGKIRFREECDSYFYEDYSKEEAIELLEEAIKWIKAQEIKEK